MKQNKLLLSTVAAFTILSSQAIAESDKLDSLDISAIDEVEVISSSIGLAQASMETKQADHLSDLFRGIPGVDVGGSHSINNKIIIRGIKDEDINITIDGAKQPNVDMFHHQSTLVINPDILKRVMIEVGANSVIHGELGGSVEFETKDGKDMLLPGQRFGTYVSTNFNSNDSISGSVGTYGKVTDNSDFFIYYNHTDNNNWKTGNGDTQDGREGEIDNILVKYGVDINDEQRIGFSYDTMKDEGDYHPRPNFSSSANVAIGRGDVMPTEYTRDTYTIKHEINKGDTLLLKTTAYVNEMNLIRDEDNNNGRGDIFDALVRNSGVNTKAQSNIEHGDMLHTLTYGASFDLQESEVDVDGSDFGEDEEAKTLALFLENAIDFDNGFILTPGIRYTHYDLDGLAGDISDDELTYSIAAEYAVNDNLTLLASYTTLFKGVPMQEVFANYRNVVKASDVESETGDNTEVGFSYIKNNVLGAQQVGFSAKYFRTVIDNYIDYTGTYPTDYYQENTGETVTDGIEASFAYNMKNFNALLSYSHADTFSKETGKPLDIETGDMFSLNLKHQTTPEMELSWQSIVVLDEGTINNSGLTEKEGYNVHDFAVKYTPSSVKGLKVIAGIDNVFDEHYASHSSYHGVHNTYGDMTDYEPGRNFKVTLSYKF